MRAHTAETEAIMSALTAQLKAGLTQAIEKLSACQEDLKNERTKNALLEQEVRRLRGDEAAVGEDQE